MSAYLAIPGGDPDAYYTRPATFIFDARTVVVSEHSHVVGSSARAVVDLSSDDLRDLLDVLLGEYRRQGGSDL